MRRRGVERACQLDPEVLAAGPLPQPTALGAALEALAAAVVAWRRQRSAVHGWALVGMLTGQTVVGDRPISMINRMCSGEHCTLTTASA